MPDTPLQRGDSITTLPSRTKHTIDGLLGDGSGGFVYRTRSDDGRERAVKLFKRSYMAIDPDCGERLGRLLRVGPPSPAFIWPQERAIHEPTKSVGYSMAIVRDAVPANRLFEPDDEGRPLVGPPLDIRAKAVRNQSRAVRAAHLSGVIVKDISGPNTFVSVDSGDVAIPDCDSIDEPGRGGILGTPGYQAVETVTESRPQSQASDLHSLAVVAFQLLTGSHPLRGQRWWQVSFPTTEDVDDLFIHHPVFLFDPNDSSNRPLSPQDDLNNECGGLASLWWGTYPPYVQELFVRAFTAGLREPRYRVHASQWEMTATRFLDSLAPCGQCGQLNSIDVTWGDGPLSPCWSCESPVVDIPHLVINGRRVALVPGRAVFPHHDGERANGSASGLLSVRKHAEAGQLALKNRGPESIDAIAPDGRGFTLEPGQAVFVSSMPRGTTLRTARAQATLIRQ